MAASKPEAASCVGTPAAAGLADIVHGTTNGVRAGVALVRPTLGGNSSNLVLQAAAAADAAANASAIGTHSGSGAGNCKEVMHVLVRACPLFCILSAKLQNCCPPVVHLTTWHALWHGTSEQWYPTGDCLAAASAAQRGLQAAIAAANSSAAAAGGNATTQAAAAAATAATAAALAAAAASCVNATGEISPPSSTILKCATFYTVTTCDTFTTVHGTEKMT